MSRMLLGIDTGGTFTDFVLVAGDKVTVHKVLSTPAAPEQAILQGIRDLGLESVLDQILVVHGSTVATNAVLEGKGVRTLYVANEGLTDVLTIGRQAREQLYALQPQLSRPPVPAEYCIPVSARLDADGRQLSPLTDADIDRVLQAVRQHRPQAVAINFLFSFLDDRDEQRLRKALPESLFVSCSAEVLPEYREYERGIATWLNAWIGPLMAIYLRRLRQGLGAARLSVMQSSGLTVRGEQAADRAVHLLLSGPAGGLAGARFMAARSGHRRLLSFDMGGTSTDVALIDGDLGLTSEGRIGGYPVAVPMVDMHTIGAGGGSIARVDEGGLLQVGPESAGADPGPACYGRSGVDATVTDANLVLGRLPPLTFLGGRMSLDRDAARAAITRVAKGLAITVEEAATGIIAVANEHMARALRVMSVQRGLDPRQLSLVSFGGAGGLHVCALAEALDMGSAIVPRFGGVLSALGMLVAAPGRELSRTVPGLLQELDLQDITRGFQHLQQQGLKELRGEGIAEAEVSTELSADLRYLGQSWTLNVPWGELDATEQAFHELHQRRYGHRLDVAVEMVNIRVKLRGKARSPQLTAEHEAMPGGEMQVFGHDQPVPVLSREALAGLSRNGPLLIIDPVATTWVASGWTCRVDGVGNILLDRDITLRQEISPPVRGRRKTRRHR